MIATFSPDFLMMETRSRALKRRGNQGSGKSLYLAQYDCPDDWSVNVALTFLLLIGHRHHLLNRKIAESWLGFVTCKGSDNWTRGPIRFLTRSTWLRRSNHPIVSSPSAIRYTPKMIIPTLVLCWNCAETCGVLDAVGNTATFNIPVRHVTAASSQRLELALCAEWFAGFRPHGFQSSLRISEG